MLTSKDQRPLKLSKVIIKVFRGSMTIPTFQLITMPEGKTLELKCDISSPRNILKTLVAFANTAGGLRVRIS